MKLKANARPVTSRLDGFCACMCIGCYPAPAPLLLCPAHPMAAGSGDSSSSSECLKVQVRDPQLKPGTIPPPHSHLSGEELPAAQCITPEEQSGSTFKAKISILKDAIKQSQGRVYREAIAVPGEKWSPEANPPGFIACYR